MRQSLIALSITLASIASITPIAVANTWQTDVIGVSQPQLTPQHWLANTKVKVTAQPLMSASQIMAFNKQLVAENEHIVDPLDFATQLTKQQLTNHIYSISSVPKSPRFYSNGVALTDKDFADYHANMNLEAIENNNQVGFGVVVKRSVLRTFPTWDRVLNSGLDNDLDRFQESGLFPGDTVAILHQSADKQWLLVRAYNYLAWVPTADIATASKATLHRFKNQDDFLLITGAKVNTAYVPDNADISELQLDMGVRLPLVEAKQVPNLLHGQNTYANYVVQLPTRGAQGELVIQPALISRSSDVNIGYLPYTQQNLIKQGFKFLGERYGWGHDYNGRDCTGFVGEIYKSFGLLMPRNSGQQGRGEYGINQRFDGADAEQVKLDAVKKMQVGDLIYIPGHVMMYLGEQDGQPYVIHDVKGLGYNKADGRFYSSALNGVSVTPLLPLRLSPQKSYLDRTYNIKRIR
ncbi:SH3 domain-containing protein [Pseudoalteromonas neustonica]|uniref:SH3 domain-containing protein n=1 Tax=Pseudoalteromonas neustonica TaxID=1840331 RepID=A0ABU9U920_9GAMM